ncbi:MAG: SAM-dependent methyltransferase [Acidimicrobiia bacterium]|nr:SAM-dependent methyltransferase [Acidimicrobiia bacterium]
MTTYNLEPIGRVTVGEDGFALAIEERFREALHGLAGFSHLNVLFWCHYLDTPEYREMVLADKPYKEGPDQVGIFATRSPARPNPIALTAVPVIGIDETAGIVRIAYIDAEPDTPILDLKPYFPAVDRVRNVATPQWCADWPQWYEDSATFDWGAVFENAQ